MAKKTSKGRVPSTTLAKNIHAIRERRGKTISQVAWNSEMGISAYSSIEKGDIKDPKVSTVCRIAEALGVKPGSLLQGVVAADFPVDKRRGKRKR